MQFFANIILLAAMVSAAALPAPASEADIDKLRSQGLSEHDIASRFPHAHATASLLRRAVDADGEVAPGQFAAPLNIRARDIEAHAGLDENSPEGYRVQKHVYAIKDFIDAVLSGKQATAGNGGVAMRRKRGVAEGEQQKPARWIYHW